MLKKLWLSRRALSPIFATLIILAVVTVLFIPVFIWASGMTSGGAADWSRSGIAATERIVIEEVNLAEHSCTIYVRNIGETAVTINNVLISSSNVPIHAFEKELSLHPPPPMQLETVKPGTTIEVTSVNKGDLIQINIENLACVDPNFSITLGSAYTVQVFTTRGVSDTYQTVA